MADPDHFVNQATAHLTGFGDLTVEEQHGAIQHAIAELENARRELDDA